MVTITKDGYKIEDSPTSRTLIFVESFNKGQKLYTLGLSKEYFEKIKGYGYSLDAKVKSSYRWDLISQDLVGKNQGMSLAHTVRHGMSHEVQVGLSYTGSPYQKKKIVRLDII